MRLAQREGRPPWTERVLPPKRLEILQLRQANDDPRRSPLFGVVHLDRQRKLFMLVVRIHPDFRLKG